MIISCMACSFDILSPNAFSGRSAPARSMIENCVCRKVCVAFSKVSSVSMMAQCDREEPSFIFVATTLRLL